MPNHFTDLLRRLPPAQRLIGRLASLESRLREVEGRPAPNRVRNDGPDSFPLQPWWTRSLWEPTVALAIRDHCRPGDTVFDVGANAGALAMMMSRLVGPRGSVLAFEASPRIVDKTQYNLVNAGCTNVTLFHKAVWHTTGELVYMEAGSHLNDRVVAGATSGMAIRTVSLDDLAAAGGFRPSFIKMDIEGAEFDALRGMATLLAEVRPVLVLEQSPEDMRCHALLTEAGYAAVDLATYRQVRSAADFTSAGGVANVLFVPQELVATNRYFGPTPPEPVAELSAGAFRRAANGNVELSSPLELPAGRYLWRADFGAERSDNEVFAGIEADGEVLFRYHTNTQFLAESYRDWVVQLERPARCASYLRFLAGADPTLRWRGLTVHRLPAFDDWVPSILE